MKLNELCAAPCYPSAGDFVIPPPGSVREGFVFREEQGRVYHAILPRNHHVASEPGFSPRVAIVGLSAASNQIADFVQVFTETGSYDSAARHSSFRGLAEDIVAMMDGLGLTKKVGLSYPRRDTFNAHPDIWATSLVKCASLTVGGDSADFDPSRHPVAIACIQKRFVAEILQFPDLEFVLVLGNKGWRAIHKIAIDGRSVKEVLGASGKTVLNLPHPSGENGEYVRLAKMAEGEFPAEVRYREQMWLSYKGNPTRKQSEATYKAKRSTIWKQIEALRQAFGK